MQDSIVSTLSDQELEDAIAHEAEAIASIRCQLIDEDVAKKCGGETRGKVWVSLAKKALIKKGVTHQALLKEKRTRRKRQTEENIKLSAKQTELDSVRFVAIAKEVLTRDQYLSIWNMVNSSRAA